MELSGEKRIWGAQIARGWALRTPQWGRDTRSWESFAHLGEKELPGGLLGKPAVRGWLEACSKHFAGVYIYTSGACSRRGYAIELLLNSLKENQEVGWLSDLSRSLLGLPSGGLFV